MQREVNMCFRNPFTGKSLVSIFVLKTSILNCNRLNVCTYCQGPSLRGFKPPSQLCPEREGCLFKCRSTASRDPLPITSFIWLWPCLLVITCQYNYYMASALNLEVSVTRSAMVLGCIIIRAVLILECIGAHGYRADSSVAMARVFKGIMFDRDYFCRGSFWSFELCTGNLTEAWLMWTFTSKNHWSSRS